MAEEKYVMEQGHQRAQHEGAEARDHADNEGVKTQRDQAAAANQRIGGRVGRYRRGDGQR